LVAPVAIVLGAVALSQLKTHPELTGRIAPKVLLPGRGVKRVEKDTLRQKWLLPWAEWMNQ